MKYEIKWVTEYLGVGRAPMSYEEFEQIRGEGVNAIVNLCHEYSDLHILEEQAGFEVYYLPICDDYAPDMDALDKALDWLDEALYCKKKVLVHCRFGQGRTGTVATAYLLRRGLDLKRTKKELKPTLAVPSSYRQWKFLRKYNKSHTKLSFQTPRIEHKQSDDLAGFYEKYRMIAAEVDRYMEEHGIGEPCGKESASCCDTTFDMPLVEALYFNDCLNRTLSADVRTGVLERAVACGEKLKKSTVCVPSPRELGNQDIQIKSRMRCPLSVEESCIMYEKRPIRCRLSGGTAIDPEFFKSVHERLTHLSAEIFLTLAGNVPEPEEMYASLVDTVSGKFIQNYFHLMQRAKRK